MVSYSPTNQTEFWRIIRKGNWDWISAGRINSD